MHDQEGKQTLRFRFAFCHGSSVCRDGHRKEMKSYYDVRGFKQNRVPVPLHPPSSVFTADSGSLSDDLLQSIEFVRLTEGMLFLEFLVQWKFVKQK
jgi:hypothetical protein